MPGQDRRSCAGVPRDTTLVEPNLTADGLGFQGHDEKNGPQEARYPGPPYLRRPLRRVRLVAAQQLRDRQRGSLGLRALDLGPVGEQEVERPDLMG